VIAVREGTAADRDFVIATARRFAAFGPPPWRSAAEVVAGEVRCLDDFFDGRYRATPGVSGPRPVLTIAEEDGTPLGFGFFEPAFDYFTSQPDGHIGMIAVTEAAGGRGAGAALMQAAEDWARRNGYPRLHLNVFEANHRARRLYERAGYAVETVRYVKPIR
jgi:GNAT superfamily N-acetyltransferase